MLLLQLLLKQTNKSLPSRAQRLPHARFSRLPAHGHRSESSTWERRASQGRAALTGTSPRQEARSSIAAPLVLSFHPPDSGSLLKAPAAPPAPGGLLPGTCVLGACPAALAAKFPAPERCWPRGTCSLPALSEHPLFNTPQFLVLGQLLKRRPGTTDLHINFPSLPSPGLSPQLQQSPAFQAQSHLAERSCPPPQHRSAPEEPPAPTCPRPPSPPPAAASGPRPHGPAATAPSVAGREGGREAAGCQCLD